MIICKISDIRHDNIYFLQVRKNLFLWTNEVFLKSGGSKLFEMYFFWYCKRICPAKHLGKVWNVSELGTQTTIFQRNIYILRNYIIIISVRSCTDLPKIIFVEKTVLLWFNKIVFLWKTVKNMQYWPHFYLFLSFKNQTWANEPPPIKLSQPPVLK